jgi:uncharacterized membrane protein YccC
MEANLKRLLYLALVATTAFLINDGLANNQGYWLIWAALIFSLITSGDTFKRRMTMIVITGMIAAFAAFIAGTINSILSIITIYLFILTFGSVFVSQRYPQYFFQAFIIILFVILASGMPVTLVENGERFVLIISGGIIAAFFQILFYPYFIRNELRTYIILTLKQLKKLNNEIFACLIDPAYSDNVYLYERRIHAQKIRFMRAIDRLRKINKLAEVKLSLEEREIYQQRLIRLDLLYDNMLDYSQLRRRVTDYTTFSVCSQELTDISQEINTSIDGAICRIADQKFYSNTSMLHEKINSLENNYHQVLQIASREPLVFLLFIDSLNAFKDSIDMLNTMPLPVSTSFS